MRKKRTIAFLTIIGALFLLLFIPLVFAVPFLECRVDTGAGSCTGLPTVETVVFRISDVDNAHAELPSEGNYNQDVCCRITEPGDTISTACGEDIVVTLSSPANAHVEDPEGVDYVNDACMSTVQAIGKIVCSTYDVTVLSLPPGGCFANSECVTTQSGLSNAHIADCTSNPYDIAACCSYCPESTGGLGETCCAGFMCNTGLICDPSTNKCVPPDPGDCNNNGFFDPGEKCDLITCPEACQGIFGTVTVAGGGGIPITGAIVDIPGTGRSGVSDPFGQFSVFGVVPGIDYEVTAFAGGYAPGIQSGIAIVPSPLPPTEINFELSPDTLCQSDCSFSTDSTCHAICDGLSGCSFADPTAKTICDGQNVGFVKEYDPDNVIVCCDGTPKSKFNVPAEFDVDADNVVRIDRVVQLPDGRFGRMVVYVFD